MNISVARGQFLAEEEELCDLVEVGFFVENGSTVLERFELIPVGRCFRVHLSFASGESVSPITIGDVVSTATEGIDGAHGQALLLWQILERMIEVACFSHGQFFAISVGEFVEFRRRLF